MHRQNTGSNNSQGQRYARFFNIAETDRKITVIREKDNGGVRLTEAVTKKAVEKNLVLE